MKRVLIIAAHPDDELLGAGGTAACHADRGDAVYSVIMCEGESLRYRRDVGQDTAIERAAKILGVKKVFKLGFPDQKLDTYTLVDLITPLEKISEKLRPNIIYCQYGADVNRDHKILFEAASVAFRPLSPWIEDFYAFYTVSSTEWGYPRVFAPDTWIDISKTLDRKIDAFEMYHSEVREYPHPRSSNALRHVAHFWGNQCSMDCAEVFITIRSVQREKADSDGNGKTQESKKAF